MRLWSRRSCLSSKPEMLGEGAVVLGPLWCLDRELCGIQICVAMRELAAQFLVLAEKQVATVPVIVGHQIMGISI